MDDVIFMLKRALENYNNTPSDNCYTDVMQALLICMKYNANMWIVGQVKTDAAGTEMLTPGMLQGDDDKYYYILCLEEYDIGERGEGMSRLEVSLNALATRIAGDGAIGGLCLNPWDGGCFITRQNVISLLDQLAFSMAD